MALKFAGQQYRTYRVYDHQPPVFVGKDKMGEDQYRANLVMVGTVESTTAHDAWAQAHNLCALPVLEIVSNVQ